MSARQRLQLAMSAIWGLIGFGTLGLKLLMPDLSWFDSFYFSLYTLTTIGYGEPPGMTKGARYFTALLIIMGVGTLGYALTAVAQSIVQFELLATIGRRRMFKDINNLQNHYIVCGAGRIGAGVIREIARRNQD